MRRAGPLALALLLGAATGPAAGHDLLDPDRARRLLAELADHHAARPVAGDDGVRAERLLQLGRAVEAMVELLNHDAGHGSLLADLVVRRLEAYGVRLRRAPGSGRYVYDQEAFREYLRRAPGGPGAAEARYRLIAGRFEALPPPDAPGGEEESLATLLEAVGGQERFLREHPDHPEAPRVRFYLAVDYYRAARRTAGAGARGQWEDRARRALAAVADQAPGSAEARAAETLLERLGPRPGR